MIKFQREIADGPLSGVVVEMSSSRAERVSDE